MVKKILDLLERYVQWGVLALGAAFLLYMIWSYLYLNPASQQMTVQGHSEPVTPGSVDRIIADGPASVLEEKLKQTNPDFKIQVHLAARVEPGPATTQPVIASQPVWDSWQADVAKLIEGVGNIPVGGQIAALPKLPAPAYVDNEPLRTVVSVTDASGQAARQDQDSVTTFWSLPVAELARTFKGTFGTLPLTQQKAIFARTVLIRQEQDSNGAWGNDTVVAAPFNAPKPPSDYPATGDPKSAAMAGPYATWLVLPDPNIQLWLTEPTYPTVADTNRPDLQWYPLEEWVKYRATQEAEEAQPITETIPPPTAAPPPPPVVAPVNPRGGFGGGPFGGGGFGGGGPRGGPGGGGFGGNPFGGAIPAPQAPTQMAPPPPPALVVNVPPIPKLQMLTAADGFNPAAIIDQGDIALYFHDLTVQPGKTYRYKVRYSLLNPIQGHPEQAIDPKLAAVFGIDSPESSWSQTITVAPRTRFWCAAKQGGLNAGQVDFVVYTWHDGNWQPHNFSAVAGDEIGADQPAGNFLTHWTLLDASASRAGSNARSVLLLSDYSGDAVERNIQTDTQSQQYKHFMKDFQALQPATPVNPVNPATPATGGAVGGGPPPGPGAGAR